MPIKKNDVVHFNYILSETSGEEIESSYDNDSADDGNPIACLIGHNNVLAAVESAMLGKEAGDSLEVVVPPEQAYGPKLPESIQRIPKKHLLTKGKLQLGMPVKINTEKGPRDVRLVKIGKFNVDIDTNHPLAGRELQFKLKITDVREASTEELSHGHVHGAGGHQH